MTSSLAPRFTRRTLLGTAATLGAGAAWRYSRAQEATPIAPDAPPWPANVSVFAAGLAGPRGMAFGDDGTLYIATSGIASTTATPVASPIASPIVTDSRATTGVIVAIAPDGNQRVLLNGLPTCNGIDGVTGPVAVAVANGGVLALIGAGDRIGSNTLLRIDLATSDVVTLVDIAAAERERNPDGVAVRSDVRDVSVANGIAYISDGGGNAVYSLDLATLALTPIAVVPPLPSATPNPDRKGAFLADAVPTGLALAPDGTVLAGYRGGLGSMAAAGSGGIFRVTADGTVHPWAAGLTLVDDIVIAPNGTVYAVQEADDPLASGATGSIVRLAIDGSAEYVLACLARPQALAFDGVGTLYVSLKNGDILRITEPASLNRASLATPVAP